jgi:hypothetical protein
MNTQNEKNNGGKPPLSAKVSLGLAIFALWFPLYDIIQRMTCGPTDTFSLLSAFPFFVLTNFIGFGFCIFGSVLIADFISAACRVSGMQNWPFKDWSRIKLVMHAGAEGTAGNPYKPKIQYGVLGPLFLSVTLFVVHRMTLKICVQ